MIVFPNCKINLGLQVINKRSDGYHTIRSAFYPVNWCDILEVIENKDTNNPFLISMSGIVIEGATENNLIYKAWKLMSAQKKIPPIKVHLHKDIPMGAGLGGGSSNAASFINLMNDQFNLGYSIEEKTTIASQLGSDCPFFIKNKAVLAEGTGNEFSEINLDLSAYYLFLVYPDIHSDTKSAYVGLTPKQPATDLRAMLKENNIKGWKDRLTNDFELSLFKKHPEISDLKQKLYLEGALYASMSGSGSTVFGIFDKKPRIDFPPGYSFFLQEPVRKIL